MPVGTEVGKVTGVGVPAAGIEVGKRDGVPVGFWVGDNIGVEVVGLPVGTKVGTVTEVGVPVTGIEVGPEPSSDTPESGSERTASHAIS